MKFGVVVFPGSNCDKDALFAGSFPVDGRENSSVFLWHKDSEIPSDIDVVILPGGFSYGDYLRCGAIARFSPIMSAVTKFAGKGGLVIGICNGFQILTESHLLPGALLRNDSLSFLCKDVFLRVENNLTSFTSAYSAGQILRIPIAHGEGKYFADEETLNSLESNNQIVFRYSNEDGIISLTGNPNGSLRNIAGIINSDGNVLGMMPHPERAMQTLLGSADGLGMFTSMIDSVLLH